MNFPNGSRAYVDNQTTFILGEGSNLTIGKTENTAGIIGVEGNGKLKINEYKGKDLYNHDSLTTTGGSIGTSEAGISNENHRKEGITRHTVIGNVEIGSVTGSPINRDRSKANETTRDDHSSTNIYVESQMIDYALHPAKFKEDVGIAVLEGSATVEGALKKIDNILRGDDNSDISEPERRRYEEIKENIIRVKTAPDMKLIAEGDLSDPEVQKRLGIGGRFNPDDPNLPEKIKDRIAQVREEGQEINYFYDKVTGKIYINENADENEIRAGIGREWGIRNEFDRGRTKPNGEGQEKGTVAGEIAYKEIEDRTKEKSDKKVNPYDFEYAQFDSDSEVTGDKCATNLCFEGDRPGQSIPLSTSKNLNNKNNEFSRLHRQLENYCKTSGKCKEEKGVYVFNDEAEFSKYNELFKKTGHRDRVKLDYKKPILKTIADFGIGAIKITGSIIKDTVKDGMFLIAGYSGAISEDMSLGIVKYRDPKALAPVEINNKSYLMGQAIGHIQMAGAGLSGEIGGNLIEGAAVAGALKQQGFH